MDLTISWTWKKLILITVRLGKLRHPRLSHTVPKLMHCFLLRPAYKGLVNNIPLSLQVLKGFPWKKELEQFVNVREIGDYLHGYSEKFGIEPEIKFNTRVERVDKPTGAKRWQVSTSTLVKDGPGAGKKTRHRDVRCLSACSFTF